MLSDLVIPLWRYSKGNNPREGLYIYVYIYLFMCFYKDIHSSSIYKSENLHITQMSNDGEK